MKKQTVVWIMLLCVLLASCVSGVEPTDPRDAQTPILGYDAQNKYRALGVGAFSFQETEDFFIGSLYMEQYIYYYDKISGISGLLCADPSCTHNSRACSANVDWGAFFYAGEGKCYYIAPGDPNAFQSRCLWKGDLAGTNRRIIKQISYEDVIMKYNPQLMEMHRGKLYFLGHKDIVDGINTYEQVTLVSTPLDDSEAFTVLFQEAFDRNVHPYVRFVNDYIYLTLQIFAEGGPFDLSILRIHTETGETETIYKENGSTEHFGQTWVTEQGEIYIPCADAKNGYLCKLENGKRVKIMSLGDADSPPEIFDGIAVDTTRTNDVRYIRIVDLAGETIYEGKMFPKEIPGINLDPNTASIALIGGDREKLIVNVMQLLDGEKESYMVLLDLSNDLEPTVLWGNDG